MLCVLSFGTVLCSPFGLIVQDTGLSTFGRTCTAFDWAEVDDWLERNFVWPEEE